MGRFPASFETAYIIHRSRNTYHAHEFHGHDAEGYASDLPTA